MADTPETKALELRASRQTLVMATMDTDGAPHVSYAPFVESIGALYVYTSSLSLHTKNMMETAKVSVMFTEDETHTRNFFARKRFTCPCAVEIVPATSSEWRVTMQLFENKFGEVFGMIRPLGDFTLFRLQPDGGLYVQGFVQAFRISADMLQSTHVTGNHGTDTMPALQATNSEFSVSDATKGILGFGT